MKHSIVLFILSVFVFNACKTKEDPTPAKVSQEQVLSSLSTNLYLSSYNSLKYRSEQLYTDIQNFISNPTDANLTLCRNDWKYTREVWENSEAWLFGPVATDNIDPRIDTWPVDFVRLDSVLNSGSTFTNAYVNGLEESLKGFHPIEYLLFGKNGKKTAAEFDAKQTAYLLALAENLKQLTADLHTSWVSQGGNFVNELVTAGNNSIYPTKLSAFQEITNSMIGICEEVADGKMGEVLTNLDSMAEESPFAQNSLTDFTNNIKGVQQVYLAQNGLSAFVSSYNLSLDARIKQKTTAAIAALNQISVPFGRAIFEQPIQVQNAIDAINSLKDELETGLLPLIQTQVK